MKRFALTLIACLVSGMAPALAQNVTINDATLETEPDTGSTSLQFTITLSATRTSRTTVAFATANTTATAATAAQGCGGGFDYIAASSAVEIPAGQPSAPVYITICGDPYDEADSETFNVNLSLPSGQTGVTITDNQGIGTIRDDDDPPLISIGNVTVTEGNTGTTNAVFDVTLNLDSGRGVTAQFEAANNTASRGACGTTGVDYATTSGTVTFPALVPQPPTTLTGSSSTTVPPSRKQTITVPVCGDTGSELHESFFVNLTNIQSARSASTTLRATGTINNDDLPYVMLYGSNVTTEGNSGTKILNFVVELSDLTHQTVNVSFATAGYGSTDATRNAADGIACGGEVDYVRNGGTLSIPSGQKTRAASILICGDTRPEATEYFRVNLSNPVNAKFVTTTATGETRTIRDGATGEIRNDD
jgi:hypothetical protein